MSVKILEVLMEWAVRATLLAALAGVLLRALRVRDVSVRSAAWTLVVVGALLLPLSRAVMPEFRVWLPGQIAMSENIAAAPTVGSQGTQTEPRQQATALTTTRDAVRHWKDWSTLAAGVWFAVAMLMLLRLAAGVWLSRRLVLGSVGVMDGVRESAMVTVPLTVGLHSPVTLLPPDWRDWEEGQLEAVLAHERAHCARKDPLRQFAASLYRALCWFHPLAWWLHAKLVALAEDACDDAALRATRENSDYAEMLVDFLSRTPGRAVWQGSAMARGGNGGRRLDRVLDSKRTLSPPLRRGAALALAAAWVPLLLFAGCTRPVRGAGQAAAARPSTSRPAPNRGGEQSIIPEPPSASQVPAIVRPGMIGRTLTLSQKGILALDYKSSARSATILRAVPSGDGVEYTIWFSGVHGAVFLESSTAGGQGALTGLPLTSADTFALRFTLLTPTPSPGAEVMAGAVINTRQSSSAFSPVQLGGMAPTTAVSGTGTDADRTVRLGFAAYVAPANAANWPAEGGLIRLLVEPAPGAIVIGPEATATARESGYHDRVVGETLTLMQSDILALDYKSWSSASVVSAAPGGRGVEYTILFTGTPARMMMASSTFGGNGSLAGIPLSSADSFALRFTLLSATPDPDARLFVGAVINQLKSATSYSPIRLGATGSTAISSIGTDATVTKTVGFVAYIAPKGSEAWPPSGATVRLLVEPAENATALLSRFEATALR